VVALRQLFQGGEKKENAYLRFRILFILFDILNTFFQKSRASGNSNKTQINKKGAKKSHLS
jgi:hypothetical protein